MASAPLVTDICSAQDSDSPLSVTSSVFGIFTFAFAVCLGAWLRYHQWNTAEREFAEFEKYLEVHTVELAWMRQLLEQGKNTQTFIRPSLPKGQSSHHLKFVKNRASIQSIPYPPTYSPDTPIEEARRERARRRIKRAGNYVVRKCREERAKKEKAVSALRYSIQMQKKMASRERRKMENGMFTNILLVLQELDEQLQNIVNKVRGTQPERHEQIVVRGSEMGISSGMPLNRNMVMQGGNSRRGSVTRGVSPKPVVVHEEFVPLQRVGSNRSRMPTPNLAQRRANEMSDNSWPMANRARNAPLPRGDRGLPIIQVAASQQNHARNGSIPATLSTLSPTDVSEPVLRDRFDRVAAYLLNKYPKSWMAKRIISMNWLRVRERAFELRKDRDVHWNRVHASQLALLSRRIEDQDEHIEMLDEHMTQQFRLVSSAILTYEGR